MQRGGGEALEEACGGTPGTQQSGGSETHATLQSLLRTHTTDDIELHCDNQGCVSDWDKTVEKQGSRETRQKCAAIWTRIEGTVQEQTARGSSTSMHWTQSHVQDEEKRKSTGSKVVCACRKASGCEGECAAPGDEHHWMHGGNDEADRLAKQSKDMSGVCGMAELLRGEEACALGNGRGVAQGECREWMTENLTNKHMQESTSMGINRTKTAKGRAQLTLWASMMKNLDSAKGISWRLWSRTLTETLPTNHKLSGMAESDSDNMCKWACREELGKEGDAGGRDALRSQRQRTMQHVGAGGHRRSGRAWMHS